MNYSEPLVSQIVVFCRALGCGILLGLLYGAVCVVRMLFGERKGVYVFFDILYFLMASLLSFFFMVIYNSGQVRLNIILAELVGGVAFHFSLGRYILGRYAAYLACVRNFFAFLARPFIKTAEHLRDFSGRIFRRLGKKLSEMKNKEKNQKNFCIIAKILLKNKNKSV